MEFKRNIIVTGGAGFIGSHVVRLFVNKYPEYHIINLDKLTYAGNLANLKDIENAANYTFIKADICDFNKIMDIFKQYQIDGVIHLAAASHVDRSIKDPFTFEFLGLDAKDAVSESDLEQALMDHLQEFMLELGQGFCFEARQKRIVIDDKYYFIDLVFYNRLLHCNVIIELKNDEFKHEDLGQLNAYVGYYKKNEMSEGDNPPVGILLCTDKGAQMVEYALSGMDNQLFVSTYMLHLPDKKTLEEFMRKEMREMGI